MESKNYQERVHQWMLDVFGEMVAADKIERSFRFFEECVELMQAADINKDDLLKIIDYVYGRDKGYIRAEMGGVILTLAAFANAHDKMPMDQCAIQELHRVNTPMIKNKVRAKFITKEPGSPLPGAWIDRDEKIINDNDQFKKEYMQEPQEKGPDPCMCYACRLGRGEIPM